MEVVGADLCWFLGVRVPGPPQPPGSPVGDCESLYACLDGTLAGLGS